VAKAARERGAMLVPDAAAAKRSRERDVDRLQATAGRRWRRGSRFVTIMKTVA
jgi:hypothetical protein